MSYAYVRRTHLHSCCFGVGYFAETGMLTVICAAATSMGASITTSQCPEAIVFSRLNFEAGMLFPPNLTPGNMLPKLKTRGDQSKN